jgi:hypothetical protein
MAQFASQRQAAILDLGEAHIKRSADATHVRLAQARNRCTSYWSPNAEYL